MENSIAVQQPWHEFLDDLPLSESDRLDYLGWLIGLYPGTLRSPDAVLPGERNAIRTRHSEKKIKEWQAAQQQQGEATVADLLGMNVCEGCQSELTVSRLCDRCRDSIR